MDECPSRIFKYLELEIQILTSLHREFLFSTISPLRENLTYHIPTCKYYEEIKKLLCLINTIIVTGRIFRNICVISNY